MRRHSILYNWFRGRLWDFKRIFPQNPFPQYLDEDNPDWLLTQALISAIRDESESHGARFVLVVLPQRNYLNGIYDPIIYDSIEKFAIREHIEFVSLLPLMKSARWSDMFYPGDGHFTPYGAHLAAQLIHKTLQNMGTP